MKHYSPTGRRNHSRPFKRLLDTWDRNGSTSGPTPWQTYDDDDDDSFAISASLSFSTYQSDSPQLDYSEIPCLGF
jgi:hypothetical protein